MRMDEIMRIVEGGLTMTRYFRRSNTKYKIKQIFFKQVVF